MALRARFFPKTEADLADITETSFNEESFSTLLHSDPRATEEEVSKAIRSQKGTGAPGPDGVSAGFIKEMGAPMVKAIASLTTACWSTGYYPERFRNAITLCLKKPGKGDYSSPAA